MIKKAWLAAALLLYACGSSVASGKDNRSMTEDKDAPSAQLFQAFNGNIKAMLTCSVKTGKPVIVAHRGGFAPGFPENALESFERAMKAAPLILEVDVISSSDGVDFLHHDDRLERTTEGMGAAKDVTWAQIKSYRLRDNSGRITDYHPVTFSKALEQLKGRVFLMLDLKAPRDTPDIVRQVEAANMLDATIFIAYNFEQARAIRAANSAALIALGANSAEKIETISQAGLSSLPYVALAGDLYEAQLQFKRLLKEGSFVLVGAYYGEDPADAKLSSESNIEFYNQAGELGVQMIVSNRPLQAYRYLKEKGLALESQTCLSK